jgi:ubiquinone/menaquinone biosynthesis C-methylase UbiE
MPHSTSSLLDRSATKLFGAGEGYDLAAEYYDHWTWQEFWKRNEFPIVLAKLLEAAPKRALLDAGVGTGAFLAYATPNFSPELRVVGLDISLGMLERAQSRLGTKVELLQADVQRHLPFSNNSFDAVIMMRAVNHLKNLGSVVSEVARVLSPGGHFPSDRSGR